MRIIVRNFNPFNYHWQFVVSPGYYHCRYCKEIIMARHKAALADGFIGTLHLHCLDEMWYQWSLK